MELEYSTSRRRMRDRKNYSKWMLMAGITFILTISILGLFYYYETKPNMNQVQPYPELITLEGYGELYPVNYQGKILDERILVQDGEYYLPLELLQAEIDPTLTYDEESKNVIYTSADKVMVLQNSVLKNEIKGESIELQFPVISVEEKLYVPFSPFEDIYPFTLKQYEAGVVELIAYNQPLLYGEVAINTKDQKPTYLRLDRTEQSPYVERISDGAELIIYEEHEEWYYVQSPNGMVGFIPKAQTKIKDIRMESKQIEEETFVPWNPIGGKINLTWEHVVSKTPNPSNITPPVGVNVVSPTWFHLKDGTGQFKNIADKRYVDWAHQNGYKVWALVTNDFNPDLTHEVLSSYEKRRNMILQLIHYVEIYDLDGINVDFENVYLKDKENLVQFMRELTPYLHELGAVVSIDVTIKSQSENWSLFLDRQALGKIVDYMMVMTYDEHWAASPVAGSVASLPWVEKGLQGILEEVPNEKILLGVPFYTRLWKEEMVNGKVKVSSKAYSMEAIEKWLTEHQVTLSYDRASGQDYGEYTDPKEGVTYKVWLENEKSMAKRIELVHKYKLAGVASWRRGFEKPSIWQVIQDGLENLNR